MKQWQTRDPYCYPCSYTICNDVTARDLQKRHQQWYLGKSCDTFCPLGPWIVPASEINGQDLQIQCWVDGELRQVRVPCWPFTLLASPVVGESGEYFATYHLPPTLSLSSHRMEGPPNCSSTSPRSFKPYLLGSRCSRGPSLPQAHLQVTNRVVGGCVFLRVPHAPPSLLCQVWGLASTLPATSSLAL